MNKQEENKEVVFDGLLAQLQFPVYRMRLITAHKIAELLSNNDCNAYQKKFLKWLSERVYETEVITGLTILGLVEKEFLIEQSVVRVHIKKPSVLSDIFLDNIYGTKTHFITWANQHSGYSPADFRPPHDFKHISTHYVAPIFKHDFEWIEENYGAPLVHHWAWEYENLKKLLGDYETSHSYFLEQDDRWEYTGSYHFKISDALQSAYLRTLNFAVSQLDMPEGFARDLATNAITLDFQLEKVTAVTKPKPLNNYDGFNFSEVTTVEKLNDFAKKLSSSFEDVLIAASFPVQRSKNYSADLDLISFIANKGADFSNTEFFEDRDIYLPKKFNFHEWVKQNDVFDSMEESIDNSAIYSAAFRIMPLRFTRWQNELVMRGLYVPSPVLMGDRFKVEYDNQQISFKVGDETVARWVFWLDNWRPCHLRHLCYGVGTALFVSRTIVTENIKKNDYTLGIASRLNYLTREKDYGSFESGMLRSSTIIL